MFIRAEGFTTDLPVGTVFVCLINGVNQQNDAFLSIWRIKRGNWKANYKILEQICSWSNSLTWSNPKKLVKHLSECGVAVC